MPIVGTAGHVDHGKSTLVEALTGRDPDRWDEEKERGLTIDLGFAWTHLGGIEVGFVDVPGHERFIKNMLAGVGGIDVALFVVAADEGWMPQSEEHLAVLDLLDVRHGVIAITRADTVDADMAELAELEVADHVAGTSLSGWPLVRTAAPAGLGMDDLRSALENALARAGPPKDSGRPRLWVDRAFTISGAGTVVTGTLVDGSVRRGEELTLWPRQIQIRVRGLQSHERDVDEASPGSRVALNVTGVERGEVERGAMIGRGEHFRSSNTFVADLRPVRSIEDPVADRGAYHLHLGSGATPVTVRLVDGAEDAPYAAVLRASRSVPLVVGDRFILREVGRKAVVAGGRVLDPHPASTRSNDLLAAIPELRAVVDESADERARVLLESRRRSNAADLAKDTGGGVARDSFSAGDLVVSPSEVESLTARMDRHVRAYQVENPMRPGMPKASLASAEAVSVAVVESIVASAQTLIDDGATVRTTDHAPAWDEAAEAAWQTARDQLNSSGLAVPRASELGLGDEVLHALLRDGRLMRMADDLVFLPAQVEEILARLQEMADGFTVAIFRDAMGMTRRQAVPVLEWLDSEGRTSRRGDVRVVRRRSSPGPGAVPPR